jgi:hypothetical protein
MNALLDNLIPIDSAIEQINKECCHAEKLERFAVRVLPRLLPVRFRLVLGDDPTMLFGPGTGRELPTVWGHLPLHVQVHYVCGVVFDGHEHAPFSSPVVLLRSERPDEDTGEMVSVHPYHPGLSRVKALQPLSPRWEQLNTLPISFYSMKKPEGLTNLSRHLLHHIFTPLHRILYC